MTSCHHQMIVDQQVDALYEKMSQKERIAQLRSTYMDELFDAEGHLDTNKCRKLIPDGIGHFSQYASQTPLDPNVLRPRCRRPELVDAPHATWHSRTFS